MSFLFYYWTYPVVMDIQTTAPEKFPIPGITFCNGNAIKPNQFCKMRARCWPSFMFSTVNLCDKWADLCEMMENKMPMDFKAIAYAELLLRKDFSPAELQNFKKPIHDFFKCRIVSTDGERNCSTEDALIGSYYSNSGFFGICYTIYSQWSRPNKNIQEMSRSDRIEIEFHVDLVDRKSKVPADIPVLPKFNYPAFPTATQLVLHNNFVSVSPHRNGVDLLGGKRYRIHVKQASWIR
ncbi:uncharacterized protein CEXT_798791 [Caerostris extrusa]|uniref:Uncharacterized protein n=1 Tax=Caerostris extrusa TaxID=172846 RepID=A0AAV4S137_CAEEX|nr:uncharacterized protein CEXT_798791 [Caerostris extrusa]